MYTIDLLIKFTPMPLSVQRKTQEEAEALYQTIMAAMKGTSPRVIELTCDKQIDKKVAVFSDQISAVIISQKTGASPSGRVPGFFATAEAT